MRTFFAFCRLGGLLFLVVWLAGCASSRPVSMQQSSYYALMESIGVVQMARQKVDEGMLGLQQQYPDRVRELACVQKIMTVDALLEDMRPMYEQLLSEDEMRTLAEYFQSSGGQKVLRLSKEKNSSQALMQGLNDDELMDMAQNMVLFRKIASPEVRGMMAAYARASGQRRVEMVESQCMQADDKLAL